MQQMAMTGVPNPYFTVHDSIVGDTTIVDGKELISFASYNYLGLSGHPAVSGGRRRGGAKVRHQRFGKPAGVGRETDPWRVGEGDRKMDRVWMPRS